MPDKAAVPPRPNAVRMFGRYQLLRLLGKSERTMAWMVADTQGSGDYFIVLPRVQPVGTAAMERWAQAVHRAARLNHPALAPAVEIGVQDGWPFAAYDATGLATLADRLSGQGLPAVEMASLVVRAAEGLAFAHEGNVGHHDLQPYLLLVDDAGGVRIAGLEVASQAPLDASGIDPGALRAQRDAAQRDVLALGIVLHHALVGQPALDDADTGHVIDRLPPLGREIVRLPWNLPHPLPDPLRAIVNRATDRQERQRYRNARTLLRALEGWLKIEAGGANGTMALLLDKIRAAGVLPSLPGAAEQAARLALMEKQHTSELADAVLNDLALSFELLRTVNTAQVRGGQVSGSGPVLTVRRSIAMLGLDGVRRAALGLRAWPGPLNEAGATALQQLVTRVKRAGRIALALRPAGYDGEVVYLITLLQNLGRLVVQYHFAEESAQIRRLMQPAPAERPGEPAEPGMSEEAAAYAVLGADIEAIGAAVARYWGLDDSVLHMIRRLPTNTPVRHGDSDDELIRLTASAANETADVMGLPAAAAGQALQRVVQRYGRLLDFSLKDLQAALQAPASGSISAATAPPPSSAAAEPEPALPSGGLRAAAAARAAR